MNDNPARNALVGEIAEVVLVAISGPEPVTITHLAVSLATQFPAATEADIDDAMQTAFAIVEATIVDGLVKIPPAGTA